MKMNIIVTPRKFVPVTRIVPLPSAAVFYVNGRELAGCVTRLPVAFLRGDDSFRVHISKGKTRDSFTRKPGPGLSTF
jgi:hypothetical protein